MVSQCSVFLSMFLKCAKLTLIFATSAPGPREQDQESNRPQLAVLVTQDALHNPGLPNLDRF